MKPRVHVISLGGTIAMAGDGAAGVVPKLDAADLVAAVPEVEAVAAVTAESFRQVASANLGFADIIALAGRIGDMAGQGIDGFVVTQGTDTLEDSAFLLACLTDGSVPVAVTGAMRNPTQVGGDGPANLLAAVCVAASGETAEHGVVVVMNDEIHTARHVTKAHRFNVAAFASPDTGPIGWVAEGRVRYHGTAKPPPRFRPVELTRPAEVALLTSVFGSQGRLLDG
ncbi:MAG: asparaginase, partial [Sphingomonadales bacterium]|nr:asparaginase [Sphingomonadales bacterium]